jgi:hypothetical protein
MKRESFSTSRIQHSKALRTYEKNGNLVFVGISGPKHRWFDRWKIPEKSGPDGKQGRQKLMEPRKKPSEASPQTDEIPPSPLPLPSRERVLGIRPGF